MWNYELSLSRLPTRRSGMLLAEWQQRRWCSLLLPTTTTVAPATAAAAALVRNSSLRPWRPHAGLRAPLRPNWARKGAIRNQGPLISSPREWFVHSPPFLKKTSNRLSAHFFPCHLVFFYSFHLSGDAHTALGTFILVAGYVLCTEHVRVST